MTEAAARTLSLNEVEQLGLKAARGAGCAWGVAEDVARAARWLAARDLPWAASLRDMLDEPRPAAPFLAALAIADEAAGGVPAKTWTLERCPPAWLLALLGAIRPGVALHVAWPDRQAMVGIDGAVRTDRAPPEADLFLPAPLIVAIGPDLPAPEIALEPVTRRSAVAGPVLHALEALALRTAVPASALSRAAGAGGGRVDDD